MPIQLTEPQQKALDLAGSLPPEVIDPRTNATYVLVPATDYETVREVLEDEHRQRTFRAVGLRNAVGRMSEAP